MLVVKFDFIVNYNAKYRIVGSWQIWHFDAFTKIKTHHFEPLCACSMAHGHKFAKSKSTNHQNLAICQCNSLQNFPLYGIFPTIIIPLTEEMKLQVLTVTVACAVLECFCSALANSTNITTLHIHTNRRQSNCSIFSSNS